MNILLADDHNLFRDGLRHLLQSMMDCQIFEANCYNDVTDLCSMHNDINLILVDLDMPGANGMQAIFRLRKELPETLIVVVSGIESVDIVSALLDAGFQGYIPKSSTSEIVKKAIDLVISGGIYIPPTTLSLIRNTKNKTVSFNTKVFPGEDVFALTAREHEVLSLLVVGNSNKEIARDLGIAETTVRTHTVSIFRTLNVNNRTQAGHMAVKFGLI